MGMPYDITAVVDENGFFDVEKYKVYSPLFMPVNLQLAYGTQFAMITAVVVHTFRKPPIILEKVRSLTTLRQCGTVTTLSASSVAHFGMRRMCTPAS